MRQSSAQHEGFKNGTLQGHGTLLCRRVPWTWWEPPKGRFGEKPSLAERGPRLLHTQFPVGRLCWCWGGTKRSLPGKGVTSPPGSLLEADLAFLCGPGRCLSQDGAQRELARPASQGGEGRGGREKKGVSRAGRGQDEVGTFGLKRVNIKRCSCLGLVALVALGWAEHPAAVAACVTLWGKG